MPFNMSCFMKLFKSHKSFDLPVLNAVQGVVKKRNGDYDLTPMEDKTPSSKSRYSDSAKRTEDLSVITSPSSSKTSIETPHHNFDYDSILNYTPIAIPASMEMKCVPKPDADDINNYDYDKIYDDGDRAKTDSGIETDEIEEANKSVSFSDNVKILGEMLAMPAEATTAISRPVGTVTAATTQNGISVCNGTDGRMTNGGNGTDTKETNSNNRCATTSIRTITTPEDDSQVPIGKVEEPASAALNPPMQTQVRRKEGVISDRIEQKSTKEFNLDLKVYEKSAETEELIKNAIINNDFLNNMMDAERLQAVVNAMIPLTLKANNYIIKEGEIGAQFFVSAEGEYDVIKDGKCIKTFGPGVVFGELAILYKARRFASIKVTTDAFVWALERRIFQKIMMKTGSQEREQNINFLSSVKVLKGLPVDALHRIGDLLKREFYATGSTIIRQGDPGDKFYIIRGGSVTVTKRSNTGEVRIVGNLKRGEYFGEQALINSDRRMASIIANEPGTECLTLDRQAFHKYLGSISELKEKPVDQIPAGEGIIVPASKSNVINPLYDHIQLSELEIVGTLGVGGFGRVELVQYNKTDTFALKILKKYEVASQGQIEHAYSEKEIMAACDSAFIVKLFKTYRNKKYLYFLMEACLGGDVWTQLQKTKYFDDRTSKFVTGCVIEAFEYLHAKGIIYRDLKPENLMIDADGYVKLVDFGFAKRVGPNHKTWTFAGTPEYVAPEIILNKGHDRSVDLWALGVFVHELLVGKPPFRGKDHMKTYNLILRGIDVVQMPQKIPKSAQNLIKALCRQIPTDRLGYLKKGISDVKKHAWYDGFEWARLEDRTLPAPLKRPIKSNIDLSNFEEYPRDRDDPPDEISGWDSCF